MLQDSPGLRQDSSFFSEGGEGQYPNESPSNVHGKPQHGSEKISHLEPTGVQAPLSLFMMIEALLLSICAPNDEAVNKIKATNTFESNIISESRKILSKFITRSVTLSPCHRAWSNETVKISVFSLCVNCTYISIILLTSSKRIIHLRRGRTG